MRVVLSGGEMISRFLSICVEDLERRSYELTKPVHHALESGFRKGYSTGEAYHVVIM
jgi:hypothetical protein